MLKFSSFLSLFCWHFCLCAQQLRPDVVASAGATLGSASNTAWLSFTTGEAVIQGEQFPTFSYGQGFHNGALKTVRVNDLSLSDWGIELWPNPAAERLWLRFSPPSSGESLYASIWSLLGQPLGSDTRLEPRTDNPVAVGHLPSGVYLLRLRDQAGHQAAIRFVKAQ